MSRPKAIRSIVAILLLAAVVTGVCWFRPWVYVSVTRELVGPDDESMDLLFKGAPLDEIQSAVRRSGRHVDEASWLGGTLLYHAVAERRIDVASWLLDQGANVNGAYHDVGGVPLEKAIRQGDETMVRLLIRAGADPDLEMRADVTPRKRAEEIGNLAILAALPPEGRSGTGSVSRPVSSSAPSSKIAK